MPGNSLILCIPALALLIWCVYNGDISQRIGIVLGVSLFVLSLVFILFKLPPPYYIVIFFAMMIYLVVKMYRGDIKIR